MSTHLSTLAYSQSDGPIFTWLNCGGTAQYGETTHVPLAINTAILRMEGQFSKDAASVPLRDRKKCAGYGLHVQLQSSSWQKARRIFMAPLYSNLSVISSPGSPGRRTPRPSHLPHHQAALLHRGFAGP